MFVLVWYTLTARKWNELLTMDAFQCDLCRKKLLKPDERFHRKGKCELEIDLELKSLSRTPDTDYICRQCLDLLRKRRRLLENISSIDSGFKNFSSSGGTFEDKDCNLCQKKDLKSHNRYRIEGKEEFKVLDELRSLSLAKFTDFICRKCFKQLKKRKQLLQDVQAIRIQPIHLVCHQRF